MATMNANKCKISRSFDTLTAFNILFISFTLIKVCDAVLCPNFNFLPIDIYPIEEISLTMKTDVNIGNYSCPGDTNPKLHTECCSEPGMRGCCPKKRYFYEIDRTLASIIAITVTSSCIVFTIFIAICCFWSRCPLYSACRAEFTADIPSYANKEDAIDMDTMPTELSGKGGNKFSPIVVSNGNLALDAEDV